VAQDRQKVVQAAEKLAARGRIQAAIDEYRKVLDRHPNDTTTLNRVGDLYVRLNRLPKAIDLFQKTAESFGRQGFFVKAIAIYKKMIRLDPGQIRAYEALADLYNRQGLTGDSLAQYQVVADYYVKHNEMEAALNVHYSMVEIEPANPTRRLQLADVLQKEGKQAQAQEQYYEIASLMLTHSRGDDALKVMTGALDVDAGNLDFVRKAMHALQNSGFNRLADELLDQAIERNPQANALRLDVIDSAAEATPQAPAKEPKPKVEKPEVEAEELKVEIEEAKQEVEALVAQEEPPVSAPDLEIELSELEELPPEGLDPVVEVASSEPSEVADSVVELETPDSESTFDLDDVEEPAAAEAAPEIEAAESESPEAVEEEFTFEFDIDEVSAQLSEVEDEAPEVIPAAPEVEPEPLEAPAAAAASSAGRSEGEWTKLLIEADVLGRYGMNEMAIAVLERVLAAEPKHTGALTRRVLLQLSADRAEEALASANGLADLVAKEGAPTRWVELCEAMAERGFELENGRFVGEAEQDLKAEPEPQPEPEPEPEPQSEPEPESESDDVLSLEKIVAETAALARTKPPVTPDSADGILAEVIEEIERADSPKAEPEKAEEEAEPEAEVAVEEDDVEWIRELERVESEATSTAPLEPGTGEFVDLATELEAELSGDGGFEDELIPTMGEQSLEDIVEGFRQGMAETLADSDFDTHYNLGIAYREMGLLDEAIGEFQLAAKDPRYLVECCSLLASCFVDKGFEDLAVQWYARGLESTAIDEDSRCGLLYELANLLAATGEPEAARERFQELYGVDSNYRDVGARLEELAP